MAGDKANYSPIQSTGMTDPDDSNIDTSHVDEHPPDVDIDQFVEDCDFRIERMRPDAVWVCAYTNDPAEAAHHYDLRVSDDGGIHITHRKEKPRQSD